MPLSNDRNLYTINPDGTVTLTITRKGGDAYHFTFGGQNLEDVRKRWWWVCKGSKGTDYYAATGRSRTGVLLLHRMLLNTPEQMQCRFLDGDMSNLRANNLENATRHDVASNRRDATQPKSGFGNVCWNARDGRWRVAFKKASRSTHIGSFPTVREALAVRDAYLASKTAEGVLIPIAETYTDANGETCPTSSSNPQPVGRSCS